MEATNEYLKLVRQIQDNGITFNPDNDRTSTGYKAHFGTCLKFDLSCKKVPLLFCKSVYTEGVINELRWFLDGNTNSNDLDSDKYGNLKIWNDDAKRWYEQMGEDHFKKRKIPKGSIGKLYGFTWNKWSTEQPFDQIENLLNNIRKNPTSRQLIVTSFNPATATINDSALPPCHVSWHVQLVPNNEHHFYLNVNKNVRNYNMIMFFNMRSCDVFLGLPFNILSYAILAHAITKVINHTTPDIYVVATELVCSIDNAHIYTNHTDAVDEMLDNWVKTENDFKNLPHPIVEFADRRYTKLSGIEKDEITIKNKPKTKVIRAPLNTGLHKNKNALNFKEN